MSILTLGLVFVAALFVSGIFSMLEAAILSQDRHRLRHLARGEGARKARQAKRMLALLRRPDRLLAVILLCNNLANVLAATVGTVAAVRIFGDAGGTVLGVSLAVTAMLLIFSEILPKMLGLRFAAPVSLFGGAPIAFLLRVLAPLVAALGAIVSVVLGAVGLRAGRILPGGAMTAAELRSVVLESRRFIPPRHGEAIVRLLNLQNTTVEEIMTPRFAIESIDISRSPRAIANQIRNARFWRLPVHRGDIDSADGFLDLRYALRRFAHRDEIRPEEILQIRRESRPAPAGADILQQMEKFRERDFDCALVVNEYGRTLGLLTRSDFTTALMGGVNAPWRSSIYVAGEIIVASGGAPLRFLRARLGEGALPVSSEAKTLNGLILERLGSFPQGPACLILGKTRMEILQLGENAVARVRLWVERASGGE